MRLDKFLKVSRLIKRRTVANEACDAGRVLVNDKPAKASVQVKTGDTIEIQFGSRNVKVEVLDVKETVGLDLEKGEAVLAGHVDSLVYLSKDSPKKEEPLFTRLFR